MFREFLSFFSKSALKALAITIAIGTVSAQAQVSPLGVQSAVKEDSLVVDQVNVNITGIHNVSKEAVYAHIKLRKGMKFDQRSLDQSIRYVYQ